MEPVLAAEDVQQLIRSGLPQAAGVVVESITAGTARVRLPYDAHMLRPGGVISGPTLMAAADTAMYACVLGHVGPDLMAVTSDMTLHFLNKTEAGDVLAEARLLKLGRRVIVLEVSVCDHRGRETVRVSGSYMRSSQAPSPVTSEGHKASTVNSAS